MSRHRWAVVLAGGDGFICEVTRRIGGDSRPAQFCRIVGGKSLGSQTRVPKMGTQKIELGWNEHGSALADEAVVLRSILKD